MAKLSVTKIFEFALIAATEAGKQIQPFVDDCNQKFEQIIRSFSELTFKDNIKGTELTLTLKHNTATTTNISNRQIAGIIPMRVITDPSVGEALTSLSWYLDSNTRLVVLPQFKTASTEARTVSLYVMYN